MTNTDNSAFILMKDEEGYKRATSESMRLFGMSIQVQYKCTVLRNLSFASVLCADRVLADSFAVDSNFVQILWWVIRDGPAK